MSYQTVNRENLKVRWAIHTRTIQDISINVCELTLQGSLEDNSLGVVKEIIEKNFKNKIIYISINMRRVESVANTCWKSLASFRKSLNKKKGELVLTSLTEQLKNDLGITKYASHFIISNQEKQWDLLFASLLSNSNASIITKSHDDVDEISIVDRRAIQGAPAAQAAAPEIEISPAKSVPAKTTTPVKAVLAKADAPEMQISGRLKTAKPTAVAAKENKPAPAKATDANPYELISIDDVEFETATSSVEIKEVPVETIVSTISDKTIQEDFEKVSYLDAEKSAQAAKKVIEAANTTGFEFEPDIEVDASPAAQHKPAAQNMETVAEQAAEESKPSLMPDIELDLEDLNMDVQTERKIIQEQSSSHAEMQVPVKSKGKSRLGEIGSVDVSEYTDNVSESELSDVETTELTEELVLHTGHTDLLADTVELHESNVHGAHAGDELIARYAQSTAGMEESGIQSMTVENAADAQGIDIEASSGIKAELVYGILYVLVVAVASFCFYRYFPYPPEKKWIYLVEFASVVVTMPLLFYFALLFIARSSSSEMGGVKA